MFFLSYQFVNHHQNHGFGYVVMKSAMPQTAKEIEAVCKRLAVSEDVESIIPLFFRELPDEQAGSTG